MRKASTEERTQRARESLLDCIREYCRQCGDGSFEDVLDCPIDTCEFYPFRCGGNSAPVERITVAMNRNCASCRGMAHWGGRCPKTTCPVHRNNIRNK